MNGREITDAIDKLITLRIDQALDRGDGDMTQRRQVARLKQIVAQRDELAEAIDKARKGEGAGNG